MSGHYAKTMNFKSNLTVYCYIFHCSGWTYNTIDWKFSVVQLLCELCSMIAML